MNTDTHDQQMDEIALDWLETSDNKDTLALRYQVQQIIKGLKLQNGRYKAALERIGSCDCVEASLGGKCNDKCQSCIANTALTDKPKDQATVPCWCGSNHHKDLIQTDAGP